MASFPSIPFSWSSNFNEDFGQNNIEMEDGSQHSQTFFSADNVVAWNIKHTDLIEADAATVRDFLKTNAALIITITDPISSTSYDGRLVGGLSSTPKRGNYYDLAWKFKGVEV